MDSAYRGRHFLFIMKTIVLFTFTVLAAGPAAAAAQIPPDQQELITMMTTGGAAELERAAARASVVPLEERSPELRAAMREALRRAAFELGRRPGGTDYLTFLHVARFGVAAHGDPADIPVLVQYNIGGAEARALYNHGHLAVPHLIEVAMSPETIGDVVRASLGVLASIVTRHGPGSYAEALAEVATLHMDGPPAGFRSREFPSGILQAIALAGAVRTPELLALLEAIGASSPAELTARTGQDLIHTRDAPACARAHFRGENPGGRCDAAAWIPGGNRRGR